MSVLVSVRFRHLSRMSYAHLPEEVFQACPMGRRPWDRPRIRWKESIFRLAWECLGISVEKLEEVARDREVWVSLLRLMTLRVGPR